MMKTMRDDQHLAEPRDDEEQRREHDRPEAQLRETHCLGEVEHVPGEPEDQRADQDRNEEHDERNREPTGDEGADPDNSQARRGRVDSSGESMLRVGRPRLEL